MPFEAISGINGAVKRLVRRQHFWGRTAWLRNFFRDLLNVEMGSWLRAAIPF
jgi:hypothetical protein